MIDAKADVCPFCKIPFSKGKNQNNLIKNKFLPPVLGVNKIISNQNVNFQIEKAKSRLKEIISFILNTKNNELPYFIPYFEIESLEIADIKDYEEEKMHFQSPDSIKVDEKSLEEINKLANIFTNNETKVNEIKEENKAENKKTIEEKFSSKDIIRIETKEIVDKKNQEEPSLNIKNLIISLDEITKNSNSNFSKTEFKTNKLQSLEVFNIKSLELEENKNKDELNNNVIKSEEFKTNEKNSLDNFTKPRGSDNEIAVEHYNLARNLCVKRDYKNALIELEKAVKLDPKFEQAHILLSRTYMKLKNDGLIYVKE
jgi:tetratricopeptide (TPR) repeat protein